MAFVVQANRRLFNDVHFRESGPLPLLEAGVCGIPIVASPAGLAPRFWPTEEACSVKHLTEERIPSAGHTDNTVLAGASARLWRPSHEKFGNTPAITLYWDVVEKQWIAAIREHIDTD
jgi:hypothetical protein